MLRIILELHHPKLPISPQHQLTLRPTPHPPNPLHRRDCHLYKTLTSAPYLKYCHFDRSAAKWRNPVFVVAVARSYRSSPLLYSRHPERSEGPLYSVAVAQSGCPRSLALGDRDARTTTARRGSRALIPNPCSLTQSLRPNSLRHPHRHHQIIMCPIRRTRPSSLARHKRPALP